MIGNQSNDDVEMESLEPIEESLKPINAANGSKAEEFQGEVQHSLLWRQVLANSPPLLVMTNNGMVTGYSATLLAQLQEPDSLISVSRDQESWIASMAPLQMALGCIFSGLLMERFGRKPTLILSATVSTFGWCWIIFATTVEHLLIGRFVTGFSVGLSCLCISCFIGEVSDPRYRGIFLSGIALGIALGTIVSHALGVLFTWKVAAILSLVLPVASVPLMLLVPESHVWYIDKDRFERAKAAYLWFRGGIPKALVELDGILEERTKNSNRRTLMEVLRNFGRPQFLKPFLLACLLFVLSQVTGNNAVVFYSVTIMQSTVGGLNRYASTLAVDVIRLIVAIAACVLTKRYKVRPLSIISGIGTALSLYLLSYLIHLSNQTPDNRWYSTIPLIPFVSYVIFVTVGLIPLSWAVCGEIFPPSTKGIGGGVSSTVNFLAFFVVVKTNPDLLDAIGISATFAVYATATLLGTTAVYFFLPETRGKTLEDIQEYFGPRRRVRGK